MSKARRPSRLEVAARDVLERLGGELEPAGDVGERLGSGGYLEHGAALVHTAGELEPAPELEGPGELEGTGDNG